MDTKDETRAPGSPDGLTSRELSLLQHYTDPESAGYQNATRSAELAGYKGLPGSNQLSVQGSRTLKKVRGLRMLPAILDENGCTFERLAKRLSACLDAQRKPVFMTKAGQVVEGPAQDDYRVQLQAVKLGFQLHGALGGANRREMSPPAAGQETGPTTTRQEEASEEYRNAVAILSNSGSIERESLRDVLECDSLSVELETGKPQGGSEEQPGKEPLPESASNKA
jgi:hypothetical protein